MVLSARTGAVASQIRFLAPALKQAASASTAVSADLSAVLRVVSPEVIAGDYPVIISDWGAAPSFGRECATLPIGLASPDTACGKPDDQSLQRFGADKDKTGAGASRVLAVTQRGVCTFVEKALAMQKLGSTAVVVVNNAADPFLMPSGGRTAEVTVPVISIGRDVSHAAGIMQCHPPSRERELPLSQAGERLQRGPSPHSQSRLWVTALRGD